MRFKRQIVGGAFLVAALACVLLAKILLTTTEHLAEVWSGPGPQCGHWCVRRCCQLLGAPVEMPAILELLPPDESGHSLHQLAEALDTIGFETEGRRETPETLPETSFPAIAHLQNPDHFVVVTTVENGQVHLLDGWGRRTARSIEAFTGQWSGNLLVVRRDPDAGPLPAYVRPARESSPRIQFDTLLVDKGAVPSTGAEISFVYPFRNLGAKDLTITRVRPDCTCIEYEHPREPVPPGEAAAIRLVYYPASRGGPFSRLTVVETNDPHLPSATLTAVGFGDIEVRARPNRIDFGEVLAGEEYTSPLFFKYTGGREDFTVVQAVCSLPGTKLEAYSTQDERARKLWPGAGPSPRISPGVYVVELSFNPSEQTVGDLEGTVVVDTNIPRFESITVPVTAEVRKPPRR